MKISFFRFGKSYASLFVLLLLPAFAWSQSTNPDAPTNVSGTEVSGSISARDLGDARLTTYYYRFDGSQGDVFINVKADNFSGDIDIFYVEGLRPVSKITFYGDASATETGRVIYLRKSEQLLLRVQGRTPDDKPATFQIKFAGSFVALQNNSEQTNNDSLPVVKKEDSSGIQVNSVGTIIGRTSTSAKTGQETQTKTDEQTKTVESNTAEKQAEDISEKKSETAESEKKADEKTDKTAVTNEKKTPAKITVSKKPRRTARTAKAVEAPKKAAEPVADPLENVRLVVLLKNGEKMEYPMTQVFRFALNNGVLSVITKDGKIARYPIIEVLKMTVE